MQRSPRSLRADIKQCGIHGITASLVCCYSSSTSASTIVHHLEHPQIHSLQYRVNTGPSLLSGEWTHTLHLAVAALLRIGVLHFSSTLLSYHQSPLTYTTYLAGLSMEHHKRLAPADISGEPLHGK